MKNDNYRKVPFIVIAAIIVVLGIFAGWLDGRCSGSNLAFLFDEQVILAETITVNKYEYVDAQIQGVINEEEIISENQEYPEIPQVEIPAGSSGTTRNAIDFHSLRNKDRFTVSIPSDILIFVNYKLDDGSIVRVSFTDDPEKYEQGGSYVDIEKAESYEKLIAEYKQLYADWYSNWIKCQLIGTLAGLGISVLIVAGLFWLWRYDKKSVWLNKFNLYYLSAIIIGFLSLDIAIVLFLYFPLY